MHSLSLSYPWSHPLLFPIRPPLLSPSSGLPPEGLVHRQPGPSPAHAGGLLEDDLGVEELLHRHADGAGGEGPGELRETWRGIA